VRRIKAEWPSPREPMVIATGGLAELVAPLCTEVDLIEPYLTLEGLRLAHEILAARPSD
jgi:type III pantothenate kinase